MTRVSQTRPGHGSGCPRVRVRVTVRAPVTRAQPISKATVNAGQRRPTKANAGQRRPTAANEGQCRPTKNRYVSFSNVLFIFYFLITTKQLRTPRRPTAANDGQRRSTQAHSSQRRPMQAHEE